MMGGDSLMHQLEDISNMEHKCEKCNSVLELCPADWPWNEDYWICPKCDSTYVFEKINE